jgi:hypothetical protein
MRLEVGKTYDHFKTGSEDQYVITRQLGPELFEGRPVYNSGVFYFNGSGQCIGARVSPTTIPNWRLVAGPEYEVRFILSDGSINPSQSWCQVKHCSAITDNGNKYLVREVGDGNNVRVLDWPEFKKLCDRAIGK